MRIVYLSPVGALGGAERSLLDMLASVRQAMPTAELLLVVATPGPLVHEAKKIGVNVILLLMPPEMQQLGDSGWGGSLSPKAKWAWIQKAPQAGLASLAYLRKLRKILTSLRPDMVHSNGIKFHLLSQLVAGKDLPVIWHIRDFLSLRPMVARILRWASHRTQIGIAISRAVHEDVRRVVGALPVETIYNAVDTEYFSPGPGDGANLDQLAGLKSSMGDSPVRVGLVATFARWKGHKLFLQAVSELIRNSPQLNARFYIIGGPIYSTNGSQFSKQELRTTIADLGLNDKVGLIGFQQNPAEIYRSLDIVVHASTKPEPFGRTIVEAMACGKPVIVSEAGGAAELFTKDFDAVGVSPNYPAALARAMGRLVADPHFRKFLGQNARSTAVLRFSRERLGPQLLTAYRRLLRTSCNIPPLLLPR